MRYLLSVVLISFFLSCKNDAKPKPLEEKVVQSEPEQVEQSKDDLSAISVKDFREFKVLDSKYINVDELWEPFNAELYDFTEEVYTSLKPLVLEQDIPTIQENIANGKLSYELLTKFYLYRIRKFDRENPLSLNSVIALNPNVIEEARKADKTKFEVAPHAIFGMPILLKDNINTSGMATTAGAVALKENKAEDAFIVKQLKSKGALILGKANLSEWAYFFCGECPSGYSAVGGQTLNPYGRRIIDTGGSSSGSGVAVAANFCVAAVGSETAGSILSPASQNSVVGLKPTVGLLSRTGIIPISSTLDTAGPMTKNVIDNAIMLDALFGEDETDSKSFMILWNSGFYTNELEIENLNGKRFGLVKGLLEDELFKKATETLKSLGAEIVEIEEQKVDLPNFLRLLNLDMKTDLPNYMESSANETIAMRTVSDIMKFNKEDSLKRMPYGQNLFKGIVDDEGNATFLGRIKDTLKINGLQYFNVPMTTHKLDGFLSINNYHAAFAAVAEYPAITIPMGYNEKGEPEGLTIIASRLQERQLLQWAYVYEQTSKKRITPKDYN